jgi:hypothetical protein
MAAQSTGCSTERMRHGRRFPALVGVALLAVLGACSSGSDSSGSSRSPVASAHASSSASSTAHGGSRGPLDAASVMPTQCTSLDFGHDFNWEAAVLTPRRPARLNAVALTGAQHVRLVGPGLLVPLHGRPPVREGLDLDWPLRTTTVHSHAISWADRKPAAGARINRGERSLVFEHLRIDKSAKDAGFSGVRIRYRLKGAGGVVTMPVKYGFGTRCD